MSASVCLISGAMAAMIHSLRYDAAMNWMTPEGAHNETLLRELHGLCGNVKLRRVRTVRLRCLVDAEYLLSLDWYGPFWANDAGTVLAEGHRRAAAHDFPLPT